MRSGVVSVFALQSGNRNSAFAFQKPDDLRNGIFGRYFDAHVDMVAAEVSFGDLAFFLLGQFVKYLFELFSGFAVNHAFSFLGYEYQVIFAIPFRMG